MHPQSSFSDVEIPISKNTDGIVTISKPMTNSGSDAEFDVSPSCRHLYGVRSMSKKLVLRILEVVDVEQGERRERVEVETIGMFEVGAG